MDDLWPITDPRASAAQRILIYRGCRSRAMAQFGGERAEKGRTKTTSIHALAWLAYTLVFDAAHLRAACRRLGFGPEVEHAAWNDSRVIRGQDGFGWLAPSTIESVRTHFLELDES